MEILAIGLNHKTAPVEVREQASMDREEALRCIEETMTGLGLHDTLVVSTCNRTEVYAFGPAETLSPEALRSVVERVKASFGEVKDDHLYVYRNEEAVNHLATVAAGLDSQIVGENEILGQVRDAFDLSEEACGCGPLLGKLRASVLGAGRRVRSETDLCRGSASVSSAAVSLAEKVFRRLEGRAVLIIGAGEMASLAGQCLVSAGANPILVANRTLSRAESLAGALGGEALPLDGIPIVLPETDVVISVVGGGEVVLGRPVVEAAVAARGYRPLLLIDISVPRSLDPAIAELETVYLKTIDDLNSIIRYNLECRERAVPDAEAVVSEEVGRFMRWFDSLSAEDLIRTLARKVESIRQEEVQRTLKKKELGEEDVERLTRSLVNKILFHPTSALRKMAGKPGESVRRLELFKDLFGLNGKE